MEREVVNFDLERDFETFKDLSISCFGPGSNLDKEMHRWLLDENPYNPDGKNLLFLLKEGEKAIGCDGLIPNELYLRGKTYLMAHSVKSMTHPDFQRQGIFRKMTENSESKGREAGVDVILGLANAASYPAYQKFGWETLLEKEVLVKPIHIKKILKRKFKLNTVAELGDFVFTTVNKLQMKENSESLSFEWLDQVPEEVQDCWDRYKDNYDLLLVRDYKYLHYRYNQRPDVSYHTLLVRQYGKAVGFVILRESKTKNSVFASVAEFFTDPFDDKLIDAMAKALTRYAYERELDYLVLSCGEYGNYNRVLKQNSFRPTPKPASNNMMIARILNEDIRVEDLKRPQSWHLSQGEGDVELDL